MDSVRRAATLVAAGRDVALPDRLLLAGVVLAAAAVAEVVVRAGDRGPGLPVALLLALAATVPVAFARAHPAAATAAVTTAVLLTLATFSTPTLAAVAAQLVVVVLLVTQRVRRRRAAASDRAASERAVADTLLEHAARGERARIARELHDVVAHHLSMISVQAETARLATPGLPAEGAHRLRAIGDTAREALTEMRRLLGVLREDADDGGTRRPQPGLPQLIELIDEARDVGGASTRLIVRGQVRPLEPGLELTAFRIVQEALTNARRHAPGAAVDVELRYAAEALHLRVRDSGPGPAAAHGRPAGGHGLLGMRERAAAVGGELWAGPEPASGFVVEAVLPTSPAREPEPST
ncbi:sensor histidine kinase [Jiangella anatolica]|uniref:histidine kinase n=1 Tax=Jiangella anatolica TaxID=2670374 RepID=A0A2W2BPI0_9ACTN|nr:two-component sensor histidine kinase [Jiangella anatolica]